MKILMIGFNNIILQHGADVAGDTRERHIKYAQALRNKYPEGGITMFVRDAIGQKMEAHVFSESLTVIAVPARRSLYPLKVFFVIRDLLKQEKYDLITTQTPFDDGFIGYLVKKLYGVSFNVQMRSNFLDIDGWINARPVLYRFFNLLGKFIVHQADTVRIISYGEKIRLESLFPKLIGKIYVLHPYINRKKFEVQSKLDSAIVKELQREELPTLLFVGRLAVEKNLEVLLRAIKVLSELENKFRIFMVGDGELKSKLQRLSEELNIDHLVHWIENQSHDILLSYYQIADVSILFSLHEGFGKVIVESYLQNTPMVVTPFVSAAELIEHGTTGLISESFDDPYELAKSIAEILFAPAKAQMMGKVGRAHIKEYLLMEDEYMNALINIWENTPTGKLVS